MIKFNGFVLGVQPKQILIAKQPMVILSLAYPEMTVWASHLPNQKKKYHIQ